MSNNRKAVDVKGVSPKTLNRYDDLPNEVRDTHFKGVNNSHLVEGKPRYDKAECEIVLGNGALVFGRDRPGAPWTGYGGSGDTSCESISLTAGRASVQNLGGHIDIPGKGQQRIVVDPNNVTDAATLLLSQKTDVDKNYNLSLGNTVNHSFAKSAAVMKADAVRLVSREALKICTRTDKRNSQSGEILGVGGIELIAGNNAADLQPLVKGGNLVEALLGLAEHVDRLSGMLDSFVEYQNDFNNTVTHHTHYLPGNVEELSFEDVGYFIPGRKGVKVETKPSRPVQDKGMQCAMSLFSSTKTSIFLGRVNTGNYRNKYLKAWGEKFINSRLTSTT